MNETLILTELEKKKPVIKLQLSWNANYVIGSTLILYYLLSKIELPSYSLFKHLTNVGGSISLILCVALAISLLSRKPSLISVYKSNKRQAYNYTNRFIN